MATTSMAHASPTPLKGGASFKILEDEADCFQDHESGQPDETELDSHSMIKDSVPLVTSKLANIQVKLYSKDQKLEESKKEDSISEESHAAHENDSQDSKDRGTSASSDLVTPTSTASGGSSPASAPLDETPVPHHDSKKYHDTTEFNEVIRLKKELDAAKDQIARQAKELSDSRSVSGDTIHAHDAISDMQNAFAAQRVQQPWPMADDARSDVSDAFSAGSYGYPYRNQFPMSTNNGYSQPMPVSGMWAHAPQRPFSNRSVIPSLAPLVVPRQGMRQFSGQTSPGSGDSVQSMPSSVFSRVNRSTKGAPSINSGTSWGTYQGDNLSPMGADNAFPPRMGMFQAPIGAHRPRPIGAPLSATAAEFTASDQNPWESRASSPGQTYIAPTEPLNYRRLLEKSVSCSWKYIVDKIIHNNDQQASIFLQQKLKVGTAEQKFDIVAAIVAQAYPLMVNRFGNFLVQRCFEHGTPTQVVSIANAIRGNTLTLSTDPFGCHVVQKAFDSVPEEYKAVMVHELLRRIPETVIHRYACHVWQKLFELRWSDSPPQIMKYVNEALQGMWHEVALGETGSLVVQNIFENCLEEDKRPCIEEVLSSIDIVAHGQFGNWCIQHICEHGAPADRTRATDHVLKYATEYSMDQFASKVVEKCLKIGGPEFLDRYLARVCEGRPDRPRIPLIDIASDQYGNYLIQYILTHANTQHRELVASHIRKHMVSLRGSKFGSRVGMLCSNPAYATRPGPGMGAQTQRYINGSSFTNPAASTSPTGFAAVPNFSNAAANSGAARFPGSFR